MRKVPSAMTIWPDSVGAQREETGAFGQAVDGADGQGLELALQLEEGDVVGLVDPDDARRS